MTDWKALYECHSVAVWKSAWRILRDDDSAADCVQETFLAVMELARVQPVRDWEGLLVSIAVRRALDELRRRCRARQRESPLKQQESGSTGPTPAQILEAVELADRLRESLARLPLIQAEVFCLRIFDEMSYREIASQLCLDEQHVGVLLHRARQGLQQYLEDSQLPKTVESQHG